MLRSGTSTVTFGWTSGVEAREAWCSPAAASDLRYLSNRNRLHTARRSVGNGVDPATS